MLGVCKRVCKVYLLFLCPAYAQCQASGWHLEPAVELLFHRHCRSGVDTTPPMTLQQTGILTGNATVPIIATGHVQAAYDRCVQHKAVLANVMCARTACSSTLSICV